MPGGKKPYPVYSNIIAGNIDSLTGQVQDQLLFCPQSSELLEDKCKLRLSVTTQLACQWGQEAADTSSQARAQLFVAPCHPTPSNARQLVDSAAAWDGIGELLGAGHDPGGDVSIKKGLARQSGGRFSLGLSCPEVQVSATVML